MTILYILIGFWGVVSIYLLILLNKFFANIIALENKQNKLEKMYIDLVYMINDVEEKIE